MSTTLTVADRTEAEYCGLRMDADTFLQIPDDGHHYELIDGVVLMAPSPSPWHQSVAGEIFFQLMQYLQDNPVGHAFMETDVHLGQGPAGGDVVYRPEVVFVRAERLPDIKDEITGAPDLVVEVISRGSRRFDTETKRADYERYGVREYWLVDPARKALTFLRLDQGRLVDVMPTSTSFPSEAVPGFSLHLDRVRKAFHPW